MEIPHILEELAYDMGELPRDAIEAAITKKEQITPYLLDILKDAIERVDEIVEDDNYQGHLYAMYLLAQFREEAAFPFILELISFPGDIPHAIAGDVLTEDISRILASVCGKKTAALERMIENSTLNEYVRCACLSSLVTLVGVKHVARSEVVSYFKSLFREKIEKVPSLVWNHLVMSACLLYPDEIYEEISHAFYDRLIDPTYISLSDVTTILSEKKESHLFQLHQNSELIEDTVSEMEKWLTNMSFEV